MNLNEAILTALVHLNVNRNITISKQVSSPFTVGESLMDRDARLVREESAKRLEQNKRTNYKTSYIKASNPYAYGYCTWYIYNKRPVAPRLGNARNWPVDTQVAQVGAVMVTYESRWGHVAYVEAVNGNYVTVSEMNADGWNVVSKRTVNINNIPLKGFML